MSYLELSYTSYVWLKAVHLIFVVLWLSFLSPILLNSGKEFQSNHVKFLGLSHLSLIAAIASGLLLLLNDTAIFEGWMHAKLSLVLGVLIVQAVIAKRWSISNNSKVFLGSVLTYVPFVLFVGIVVCVVVRPF